MDISPKTIILHPCPVCNKPMEVELVEIRKQLIEGQIDLDAVTKEWRHICTKCDHDTTKYIKVCHYCNVPDDISKLQHNATAIAPEKAYFHPSCEKRATMPHSILAVILFLIVVGIMVGVYYVRKSMTSDDVSSSVKIADGLTYNLINYDLTNKDYKKKYDENKDIAIKLCKEALKKNPRYARTYLIFDRIYNVENNLQEAADVSKLGLSAAKQSTDPNDLELKKNFEKELEILKKKGIQPKH